MNSPTSPRLRGAISFREIEIIPAVLRRTWEGIKEDWDKVAAHADHIQIDITDGVFAGDGTYREINEFKKLEHSEKIGLHLMVHNPGHYVDEIVNLNPARIAFHIEAFSDGGHAKEILKKLRSETSSDIGLAINPASPVGWLSEHAEAIDYALFLGVNPGYPAGEYKPKVERKIGQWRELYPNMPISVDGHVNKETIPALVKAGAIILCANSAIFKEGNPQENIEQLRLVAQSAL